MRDKAESEKLAVYEAHLPDMEKNLPMPGRAQELQPEVRVADPRRPGDLHVGRRAARRPDLGVQPAQRRARARGQGLEEGPSEERHGREVPAQRTPIAERVIGQRPALERLLRRLLQPRPLPRALARPRTGHHHGARRQARRGAPPPQEPLLDHRGVQGRRRRNVERPLRDRPEVDDGVRRESFRASRSRRSRSARCASASTRPTAAARRSSGTGCERRRRDRARGGRPLPRRPRRSSARP